MFLLKTSKALTGAEMSITDFHICIVTLTRGERSLTRSSHFARKGEMNDIPFYIEVPPTPPCGSEVASLALSTDYDRRYPSPHRPYPHAAVDLSGRRPARRARSSAVGAWMGPHRQPRKGADCPLSYSTGGTGGP